MKLLGELIKLHRVKHIQYANDTQLYTFLTWATKIFFLSGGYRGLDKEEQISALLARWVATGSEASWIQIFSTELKFILGILLDSKLLLMEQLAAMATNTIA